MRKLIISLLILGSMLNAMPLTSAEEVKLENVQSDKIELKKPEIRPKESLLIDDKAIVDELIKLQKEKDIEDIEILWD